MFYFGVLIASDVQIVVIFMEKVNYSKSDALSWLAERKNNLKRFWISGEINRLLWNIKIT